jgi:hypothetical protein
MKYFEFFDFSRQGAIDRMMEKQRDHGFMIQSASGYGHGRMRFVDTSYEFGDPRAQTAWSKAVFVYGLENRFFTPMMGNDANSLIHVSMELSTRPGGTIVFESGQPIDDPGVGNDGNTTGNEAQIKRRNMSLTIGGRAQSTVSAGDMSEQLTRSNFRTDSKKDLGDWIAEAIEDDINTAAYGGYNENSSSSAITTINEVYPTSDRIYYGGQSAAGTLGNSGVSYGTDALLTAGTQGNNLMGTVLLEAIKRRAIAATPRFRPVSVRDLSKANPDDVRSGQLMGPELAKVFVVLCSPLQIKAIKAETGTIGFKAMQADANNRGHLNPIFRGASFYWDGLLVFEYDRVASRTGAGGTTLAEGFLLNAGRTATTDACASGRTVDRALLMGAQALAFGWAKKPTWTEDFVDNDKPKIKTAMIYGVKPVIFNAHGTETAGSTNAIFAIDTEVIVDA